LSRKFLFYLLTLSLLLTAFAVGAQDTPLPPEVIDVQPFPGVELAPGQPLALTFDQPMDQGSVQAAFSIDPALAGAFVWPDARTLQFVPSGDLPRSTEYTIAIDESAESEAGISLEAPFSTTVQTIGDLLVAQVTPEPGATLIDVDSRIVVTFDRPVVPLLSTSDMSDLPNPIAIEPVVEGVGEWLNTSIYTFMPSEPMAGDTTYTVTVDAGLTAADGARIPEAYEWTFRTAPPQVIRIQPETETAFAVDQPITLTFSEPMDQATTESAFRLVVGNERIEGVFSWNADSTEMTFTPDANLPLESETAIALVEGEARNAAGTGTLENFSVFTFTRPYPRIASSYPADGETDVNASFNPSIRIEFNTPINPETLEGRIEIEPEGTEWYPQVFSYDPQIVYLWYAGRANTTYTVTIKAGVEDTNGNPIPEDYRFSFTTSAPQPDLYPIINGMLQLTNANRPDTRFQVMASGDVSASYQLFEVSKEFLATYQLGSFNDFEFNAYDSAAFSSYAPFDESSENWLRSWSEDYNTGEASRVPQDVLLSSEDGGQLDPGLYWVSMNSSVQSGYFGQSSYQFALGVVNANLTIKRTPQETLVWATDLETAQPLSNLPITIYQTPTSEAPPEIIASGMTDADGLFSAPLDLVEEGVALENPYFGRYERAPILIIAESDTYFGVWNSLSENVLPTESGYLYTDRPIYRPGETVYYRGVLRSRFDMDYNVPDLSQIAITIKPEFGDTTYYEGLVEVTPFGTFSGEFVIPEEAALGTVRIQVDYGDGTVWSMGGLNFMWDSPESSGVTFQVADFRVPEYEVSVTASQESVIQGDPLNALIEADYYAGGGVGNASITTRASGSPTDFDYTGPGSYSFRDEYASSSYYNVPLLNGMEDYYIGIEDTTNEAGQLLLSDIGTVPPVNTPMEITIEGSVMDESGQTISGRSTVIAHPAAIYAGVRAENWFGQVGEPSEVEIITVTPESMPVPDTTVEIDVAEASWERQPIPGRFGQYNWEEVITPVETGTVITGREATATYQFTPPKAGVYIVRTTVTDSEGRTSSSTLRLYIQGDEEVLWNNYGTSYINPIKDQESYTPGETAQLIVPIPFEGGGTILVTAERADVMLTEIIETDAPTLIYELPITDEYAPTVHVSFTVLAPAGEDGNPNYSTGYISLNVEPVSQRLNVEVTPSQELNPPRGTVSFDLRVTDADGNPIQTEFGVALTDEAVLALAVPNTGTLEELFYRFQTNSVVTRVAMSGLIDLLTDAVPPGGYGGGGGGDGEGPLIREDFVYTPLWAPHVVTDENGEATVSVTLPDNLTTWRLDARGVTLDTQVGQVTTNIVSTLPLIVRPSTPRFLVVGDQVTLAAVINNNTDQPQEIEARLEASGVTLTNDAIQTVTVPAASRARVEWQVTVEDVEGVDLTFFALGEGDAQDAAKPALTDENGLIPVYRYTAPDTVATGGVLLDAEGVTEGISLPPRLAAAEGNLTVRLDPSLAATTLDSLDYFRNYNCQCIEQTVSRFLPNIVTYAALSNLGIEDAELQANLEAELQRGLALLSEAQNPDGGWGWFAGMESDPLVTAYALLGLIEAADADVHARDSLIDHAAGFLLEADTDINDSTPTSTLNRQAFYAYVLARWRTLNIGAANGGGGGALMRADELFEQRLRLNDTGRAFLLLALHEIDAERGQIDALISDLTNSAILSANGAHWESGEPYNWDSDTRTTALAVLALARTNPDNALLPNAVRWLMTARLGDHWATTQETVWGVLALSEWMTVTGELNPDYEYNAALNNTPLAGGNTNGMVIRDSVVSSVDVADLLTDEANRLTIARSEGEGALYYTAYLNLQLPADQVEAISRGIAVSREYFNAEGEPISEAEVGDIITVRLSLTLPQDIYFFALESPLPAGTENLDPTLLTTTTAAQAPQVEVPFEENPYWFWNIWAFDRTEQRDEMTALYADFLPRGSYVYSYQVQATVPGTFQTLPAQAYAFYQPEVFGRTDGGTFTVELGE
jgi:alpha-2-macroglobulin